MWMTLMRPRLLAGSYDSSGEKKFGGSTNRYATYRWHSLVISLNSNLFLAPKTPTSHFSEVGRSLLLVSMKIARVGSSSPRSWLLEAAAFEIDSRRYSGK